MNNMNSMNSMCDFFGVELGIGDEVALTPFHHRGLVKGVVVGFTAGQVRTEYPHQGITVKILMWPATLIINLP